MMIAVILVGAALFCMGVLAAIAAQGWGLWPAAIGFTLLALGVIFYPTEPHQSPASEANWVCSEYGGVASTDVSGNVFTCKDGHSFEFHG